VADKRQLMHDAGMRVFHNYQSTGTPFALFLSSWSFDEARKFVFELTGQGPREVQVRIGLERQVRLELQRDGLDTLAVYREGDDTRIAVPDEWPSLTLGEDTWLKHVEELARLADMIVLFWGVTTDGLAEELAICDTDENRIKTVAISNVTPTQIFLHQLHRLFPRFVPLNEIPPPPLPLPAEFTPLIGRMKALLALDPALRAALTNPVVRTERFPFPPASGRFDREVWITRTPDR
jgi:hypothetical protein